MVKKSLITIDHSPLTTHLDVFNLSYNVSDDEEKLFRKLVNAAKYDPLRLVQLKRNPGETVFQQLLEFLAYSKPDWVVMFLKRKVFFKTFSKGVRLKSYLTI